jgi:hypothetical protein
MRVFNFLEMLRDNLAFEYILLLEELVACLK